MDKKEYIADKVLEEMLKAAASDIEDKTVESLLKGYTGQDHEFSERHIKEIEKLFARERKDHFHRKLKFFSKRVAIILLIITALSAVTIGSVDALRVRFINFIIEMRERDTDIKFIDDSMKSISYSFENITLEYIPEGFELEKSSAIEQNLNLKFVKGQEYFNLNSRDISNSFSIDTENASVKQLLINGRDALYSIKENNKILVWHDDNMAYIMTGNISETDMIKIAENIKK
ncbi:MAG: DUF4367 domain-containing protein [Tissierellia bacterium]|nr:DUF4367 domain-containing protein [Tissierellia bacterium]